MENPSIQENARSANSRRELNARSLIRLRWWAILGQTLTILVADTWFIDALPVWTLLGVIVVEAGVNIGAFYLCESDLQTTDARLAGFILVDLLILTALLYLSGGPHNPFNFLYIVQIALASIILPRRWTWGLTATAGLLFGLLFVDHYPIFQMQDSGDMQMHLQGMWVAFVVAAFAITAVVGRLAEQLEARTEQLEMARQRAHRTDKMSTLAALATGVAHELGSPLSTIAVVANDLELQLEESGNQVLEEDAALIRKEVERCRDILNQLAANTGQTLGDGNQSVSIQELVHEAIQDLDAAAMVDLDIERGLRNLKLDIPHQSLIHALKALVENALDVSPADSTVGVRIYDAEQQIAFAVTDRGPGMDEDIKEKATEPFFSEKESGMGLGLFLAETVARRLGGELSFKDTEHGTTVKLTIRKG